MSGPVDPAVRDLLEAASHLCWLALEHAGLSEPEDVEAVRAVERAMVEVGWSGPTYAPELDEDRE